MKKRLSFALAMAVLAVPALAGAAGAPTPHQFCQVQFVEGGPVYDGTGMTVRAPGGQSLSVCRVRVDPPAATTVTTFRDSRGDIVVVTRSGAAIVVFHTS